MMSKVWICANINDFILRTVTVEETVLADRGVAQRLADSSRIGHRQSAELDKGRERVAGRQGIWADWPTQGEASARTVYGARENPNQWHRMFQEIMDLDFIRIKELHHIYLMHI